MTLTHVDIRTPPHTHTKAHALLAFSRRWDRLTELADKLRAWVQLPDAASSEGGGGDGGGADSSEGMNRACPRNGAFRCRSLGPKSLGWVLCFCRLSLTRPLFAADGSPVRPLDRAPSPFHRAVPGAAQPPQCIRDGVHAELDAVRHR